MEQVAPDMAQKRDQLDDAALRRFVLGTVQEGQYNVLEAERQLKQHLDGELAKEARARYEAEQFRLRAQAEKERQVRRARAAAEEAERRAKAAAAAEQARKAKAKADAEAAFLRAAPLRVYAANMPIMYSPGQAQSWFETPQRCGVGSIRTCVQTASGRFQIEFYRLESATAALALDSTLMGAKTIRVTRQPISDAELLNPRSAPAGKAKPKSVLSAVKAVKASSG